MTEDDGEREAAESATGTVRVWLVERDYDDRNLVTLVYATPDGERYQRHERSAHLLSSQGVTAATDADPADLESVDDEERRERYAEEVDRVRERHDPGDTL
ncbi:hypothetical protein [Halomarina oriensis]|uniref:DUF7967 domain-containing protein n=1 Tax=Halomarina oriensis TaxID=671145 RepID=A0A6B0GKA3_9EURY|nr:hypothetical protein [Halomarina oriensis]MWG34311.1 hypothetical protein [Halomarina oriensis]